SVTSSTTLRQFDLSYPARAVPLTDASSRTSARKSSSWVRSTRRSTSSTSASQSATSSRCPQCIVAYCNVCCADVRPHPDPTMSNVAQELETVRDWLRYAVSRFASAGLFFVHGIASAYEEAAYLLRYALKLPSDPIDF